MEKFFKLGKKQSIFWDPSQPNKNNQKIVGDWVVPMEMTPAVEEAKRNERILPATKKEVEAFYASINKPVPGLSSEEPAEPAESHAEKKAAKTSEAK